LDDLIGVVDDWTLVEIFISRGNLHTQVSFKQVTLEVVPAESKCKNEIKRERERERDRKRKRERMRSRIKKEH
jgi:hypothetical protein